MQAALGMSDEVCKSLGPHPVRDTEVFVAPTKKDDGPVLMGGSGALGGQSGLAHSRLSADENQLMASLSADPLEHVIEQGALAGPPNETRGCRRCAAGRKRNQPVAFDRLHGSPSNFNGGHGIRQTLQLKLSERDELLFGSTTSR